MMQLVHGSPLPAVQGNRRRRSGERVSSASGRSYKPRNLAKRVTVE
jgi:hypothetical protein